MVGGASQKNNEKVYSARSHILISLAARFWSDREINLNDCGAFTLFSFSFGFVAFPFASVVDIASASSSAVTSARLSRSCDSRSSDYVIIMFSLLVKVKERQWTFDSRPGRPWP